MRILKGSKKFLITMCLIVSIFAGTTLTAQAKTEVTFNLKDKTSNGPYYSTFTFDAESMSNWVGVNYLQSGTFVSIAQGALKSCGYDVGTIDGFYGTKTENGIRLFQKAYNLGVDGIVGTNTWTKLNDLRGWYTTGAVIIMY